jgi:zinc protease
MPIIDNLINRKIAPPIKDAIDFHLTLQPFQKYTLNNGIPVYAVHAGAEEVLQIEWVFFAGSWYEQQNLEAAATNFLLKNGTSQKTAFQINEHFEYYGASLKRGCYAETAVIALHCLNKHTHHLLPVVAELITEAHFPEDELQLYKQNNKQRLSVSLQKCDFVANRLIDEYLFGFDHPYGQYSHAETYDALTRNQLQGFYQKFYQQGHCVIFIAGKLPTDIIEQLNKNFGSLPLNQTPIPSSQHQIQPAQQKKYNVINDAKGLQAAIRIARPFYNRHHPHFMKAMVLNNVLGGFFGSRLMSNIREDKGYTYGIHSYLQNLQHEGAWMISTEAGREVANPTIAEVYIEMERLRKEPISQEELLLVKNYMMGTILGDLDGPFQIIGRWKTAILHQLPDNYFYEAIKVIKEVSAEELQQLANTYLQPDEFYELVVI